MFKNLFSKINFFKRKQKESGKKEIEYVWRKMLIIALTFLAAMLFFDFWNWRLYVKNREERINEEVSAIKLNKQGLAKFKSVFEEHQKFLGNPQPPFILRDVFK